MVVSVSGSRPLSAAIFDPVSSSLLVSMIEAVSDAVSGLKGAPASRCCPASASRSACALEVPISEWVAVSVPVLVPESTELPVSKPVPDCHSHLTTAVR